MPAPRIVYIENKSSENPSVPGLSGCGTHRVGDFRKDGQNYLLNGKSLQSLNGTGFKSNFYDIESAEEDWISGRKKNGADGLYGPRPTPIDTDVYRYGRARRILHDHQKTAKQSSPENHLDSLPLSNSSPQLRILLCQPSRRTISFPSYLRVRKYQP